MDETQLLLWRWARTYYNVQQEMNPDDRPSSDIIDNDAKFDRWIVALERDYQTKRAKSRKNRIPEADEDVWKKIPKFTGD